MFCLDFFNTTADFLLINAKYPLQFTSGNYNRWIFPCKSLAGLDSGRTGLAYCFEKGRLQEVEEILNLQVNPDKYRAKASWNSGKKDLDEVNLALRNHYRLRLGEFSLMAYYLFFIYTVGFNESQATDILWEKDFEAVKSKQKLRRIKARAGNKEGEFEIQSKFISYFRKFLMIRSYLFGNNQCEYLFFSLDQHHDPYISYPKLNFMLVTLGLGGDSS